MTETGMDPARSAELTGLLRACRARIARPPVPGTRGAGMRQEDIAQRSGLSLRHYADIERGRWVPSAAVAERIAVALQMSEPERSALHVLATGQDPPRAVIGADLPPPRDDSALRQLVRALAAPAALTNETWTVLYHNEALDAWTGGWFSGTAPARRHLACYLFSEGAARVLPGIDDIRRGSVAALRYQYARNVSSPRFADVIACLLEHPAAARLWAEHEVAFVPDQARSVIAVPGHGLVEAQRIFLQVRTDRWVTLIVVPDGVTAPG